jgi:hypothetical protein
VDVDLEVARRSVYAYFKSKKACKNGCFDRAPNGGDPPNRVLHDIRAPKIVFLQPPAPPAGSMDYTLDFTVTDPGGATLASGVDKWELQHRNAPGEAWTDVVYQGTDAGAKELPLLRRRTGRLRSIPGRRLGRAGKPADQPGTHGRHDALAPARR